GGSPWGGWGKATLESQPKPKLDLSGGPSFHDLPESPSGVLKIVRYGTRTRTGGRCDRRTRIDSKLRVIEAVEGLHPELQANPFGETKSLCKGDVPIVDSGTTQNVAARVAKCARKRLRETRCIEPLC